VLIGLGVVALFGLRIADPLAGVAVAVIIGTTAIEQGRRTTQVLLDAMPDRETLRAIERILETDSRLHGYHALRARQAGQHVLLDVSVHVDGDLSLSKAHEVGHAISERIRHELPIVTDAVVHVEPVDDEAHG
jgi:cation diffusion facilitator family transporter